MYEFFNSIYRIDIIIHNKKIISKFLYTASCLLKYYIIAKVISLIKFLPFRSFNPLRLESTF